MLRSMILLTILISVSTAFGKVSSSTSTTITGGKLDNQEAKLPNGHYSCFSQEAPELEFIIWNPESFWTDGMTDVIVIEDSASDNVNEVVDHNTVAMGFGNVKTVKNGFVTANSHKYVSFMVKREEGYQMANFKVYYSGASEMVVGGKALPCSQIEDF